MDGFCRKYIFLTAAPREKFVPLTFHTSGYQGIVPSIGKKKFS